MPFSLPHQLPLQVLSHIMHYLDFSSRREVALVCRLWYEATLDPVLLKNLKYTFDASMLNEESQFTDCDNNIAGCICKCPNLHIVGLDNNFNAECFLKLHKSGMEILGPHVEHLSLKNSNIVEGTLIRILQLCPNIKSLDISGCNPLFMSGIAFTSASNQYEEARKCLKELTALNLSASRFVNDSALSHLFKICPSIQSINLSSNTFLSNAYRKSQSNCLSFLGVLQLISQRASSITHVDFSRSSFTSDALSMLALTKGLNLKSVVLQNCRELTDRGVVELARLQRGITSLILSGCTELGNASLCAICEDLEHLEVLQLRRCSKITSVKNLNKLPKLVELDLSGCHDVTMAGLRCGLNGMEQLRVLQLKGCNLSQFKESLFPPTLHHENIAEVIKPPPSLTGQLIHIDPFVGFLTCALRHLDIESSELVDDNTLQAVNIHLVNLEVLKLSWSPSITDRGLLGLDVENFMIKKPKTATEKEIKENFLYSSKYSSSHGQAGLIKNPGEEFIPEKLTLLLDELPRLMESKGITRLRKLRHLSLANCKKLTPVGLLHVFRYKRGPFPRLEVLDLGMLRQAVNDDVLTAITNCSTIRSLTLSFCPMVSDQGLQGLCRKLRSLDTLGLSGCDGITERTINNLARHCGWLKELDLSMCGQISAETAKRVKDKIPSLLRLHTRYSGGASLDQTL